LIDISKLKKNSILEFNLYIKIDETESNQLSQKVKDVIEILKKYYKIDNNSKIKFLIFNF
jgi:hypothetical protein